MVGLYVTEPVVVRAGDLCPTGTSAFVSIFLHSKRFASASRRCRHGPRFGSGNSKGREDSPDAACRCREIGDEWLFGEGAFDPRRSSAFVIAPETQYHAKSLASTMRDGSIVSMRTFHFDPRLLRRTHRAAMMDGDRARDPRCRPRPDLCRAATVDACLLVGSGHAPLHPRRRRRRSPWTPSHDAAGGARRLSAGEDARRRASHG